MAGHLAQEGARAQAVVAAAAIAPQHDRQLALGQGGWPVDRMVGHRCEIFGHRRVWPVPAGAPITPKGWGGAFCSAGWAASMLADSAAGGKRQELRSNFMVISPQPAVRCAIPARRPDAREMFGGGVLLDFGQIALARVGPGHHQPQAAAGGYHPGDRGQVEIKPGARPRRQRRDIAGMARMPRQARAWRRVAWRSCGATAPAARRR